MEKEYLIEPLFDRINKSDALEAELQDIQAGREGITIAMKDGTVFLLSLTE